MSKEEERKPLHTILSKFFEEESKKDLIDKDQRPLEDLSTDMNKVEKNFQSLMQVQEMLVDIYEKITI